MDCKNAIATSITHTSILLPVRFTRFDWKEKASEDYIAGFVTVKNDTCHQILKAWTIHYATDRLIEVHADSVTNWFGYDG